MYKRQPLQVLQIADTQSFRLAAKLSQPKHFSPVQRKQERKFQRYVLTCAPDLYPYTRPRTRRHIPQRESPPFQKAPESFHLRRFCRAAPERPHLYAVSSLCRFPKAKDYAKCGSVIPQPAYNPSRHTMYPKQFFQYLPHTETNRQIEKCRSEQGLSLIHI